MADKVRVADFVIDTTGPIEAARKRADEVLVEVCKRVGVEPGRYELRTP